MINLILNMYLKHIESQNYQDLYGAILLLIQLQNNWYFVANLIALYVCSKL